MTRTLIRLGTKELIDYAQAEANDISSLKDCLEEINFRTKAIAAGKFDELIPWIDRKIREINSEERLSQEQLNRSLPDEGQLDNDFYAGFSLSKSELKAFLRLCACFVLLDNDFSDDEAEFVEGLLTSEQIDIEFFEAELESVIGKNVRRIAEGEIAALRDISAKQKQDILTILFELSKSDGKLHVEEKLLLEGIKKHWGLDVIFGRGELDWTEEQLSVIEADEEERIVVNAMPGSGKTAVACAKISHLIDEGVPASQIWLLSFTRTAVQELRDRIASFAEEDDDVIGVKIATIDSRAWQIRFGMRDEQGKNLFESYDLSIAEALSLIKESPSEYEQAFGRISHLIIDEAQDITGVRLKLVEQIVGMLPETCGITIFGDEAQAIYGFSSEEGSEADGQNYLKLLRKNYSEDFQFLELTTMHRTDNVALQKLVDELRLEIQVEEPSDVISHKEASEKIASAASSKNNTFEASELAELEGTLILFRRRSDVLQACNFANQSNIKYRLRMGGLSVICRPWIAQIFYRRNEDLISLESFHEIWNERQEAILDCGDTAFSAFDKLKSVANQGGKISLKKLRTVVSRGVPPVQLCVQDLGTTGPILGTIHASKGREADNVRLFLNTGPSKNASNEEKAEETRVLFVGASRAKNNLSVGKGFVSGGSILNGRSYKRTKDRKKAQVEIGKDGDFDEFSLVNKNNISSEQADKLQKQLVELLASGPKDVWAFQNPQKNFVYDLYVMEEKIWIGQFNQLLNYDLFKIKDHINPYSRNRLPREIRYLKLIGLNSVAMPDTNDHNPMFDSVIDAAKNSGFWLTPVIMGYPTIGFW